MNFIRSKNGPGVLRFIEREEGYFFMFGKNHFICLKCQHTVSGVKNYHPRCPKGHGDMIEYDMRLRIPKKNSKKWKQFWSITIGNLQKIT